MGIFDFGNSKPRVSPEEFRKKVRLELYQKGLNEKQLDQVEGLFSGALTETRPSGQGAGIQSQDVDHVISWLRTHPHDHTFSPEKIDEIEVELKKYL